MLAARQGIPMSGALRRVQSDYQTWPETDWSRTSEARQRCQRTRSLRRRRLGLRQDLLKSFTTLRFLSATRSKAGGRPPANTLGRRPDQTRRALSPVSPAGLPAPRRFVWCASLPDAIEQLRHHIGDGRTTGPPGAPRRPQQGPLGCAGTAVAAGVRPRTIHRARRLPLLSSGRATTASNATTTWRNATTHGASLPLLASAAGRAGRAATGATGRPQHLRPCPAPVLLTTGEIAA